jgi:hypothetical protein
LNGNALTQFGGSIAELEQRRRVHPGGIADRYEYKAVAGKAIRKTMKTKGPQSGAPRGDRAEVRVKSEEREKQLRCN